LGLISDLNWNWDYSHFVDVFRLTLG
jgi:hypothetical protein